jgi:apolipoprotein N-acyltransferase
MSPLTFLIFIAFVPLFWLEARTSNGARFFQLVALNMFIWNLATTWWIWNASPGGAAGAIVANSMLMCFPWMLFRFTKQKLGKTIGYLAFILYWITWEYIHHNWDLSWPWLTLGNVFSTNTQFVQWYEYVGTTGGSFWVLLVNVLLFKAISITNGSAKKIDTKYAVGGLSAIIVPALLSTFLMSANTADNDGALNNIVVIQPNIHVDPQDPSKDEKFNTPPNILIEKMIAQSESKIDANTRMVVWPETAIPVQVWEHEIPTDGYYQRVFEFVKKYPSIMLVTGIDSYKLWGENNPGGFSIRTLKNGEHYEAFNTAMATDNTGKIVLYHKSKLVPGPESLPSWLGFMGSIFSDLGGSSGTLGKSDSAVVFSMPGNPYKTAPIICYESIYSNYVTEYVRNGANVLSIITNDGWWKNTPGYRQHESMARLRAIETRRWVVRSANTGISCFINPNGTVLDAQPWDTAAVIKMNIPPRESLTFYAKHGDWLSNIAWPLAAIVLLWGVIIALKTRKAR